MSETKADDEPHTLVPEKKETKVVIPKQEEEVSLPNLSMKLRKEELDPMELLTQRAIAIQLKSLRIEFTNSALEDLFDLVSTYIHGLLQGLQGITQTQRRFKAAPKDLKLLLRNFGISTGELEEELERSKKDNQEIIQRKKTLEQLANETLKNSEQELEEIDPQDPSFVFFASDQELSKLIPPQHKRTKAIPRWLPEFPPDHTYRKTPKYLDRIKDQKLVRQKIVEESKFGEQALENLIKYAQDVDENDDEMNEIGVDENLGNGVNENEVVKKEAEVNGEKYDIWSNNEKKFDLQAYTVARLKYYKEKEEKKKQKLAKIDHEYYQIIEQLSAFGSNEMTNETLSSELYLEREFKKTFSSLKSLKRKKAKRQVERERLQDEEDRRRDEAKAKAPVDFNDFDNFDNFENFENFDNFDGDHDLENAVTFEGVDDEKQKSTKEHIASESINESSPHHTEDTPVATSAEPSGEPITQRYEHQSAADNDANGGTTNPTSDFPDTTTEPPSTAPEVSTHDQAPQPTQVQDNKEEGEEGKEDGGDGADEDEDEDMFDDVPLA